MSFDPNDIPWPPLPQYGEEQISRLERRIENYTIIGASIVLILCFAFVGLLWGLQ